MAQFTDPNELIVAVNAMITDVMNGPEGVDAAKKTIAVIATKNVYAVYDPTLYNRKGANGGILDGDIFDVTYDAGAGNFHEIRVADERSGIGRIESGTGYTWRGSRLYKMQPFPRPYFNEAETEFAAQLEAALQSRLAGL